MINGLLVYNIIILIVMSALFYGSFHIFKIFKVGKILPLLIGCYALISIALSIINISFLSYYNPEKRDEYFKNHPENEILQNVNWYMLVIPLFIFFIFYAFVLFYQGLIIINGKKY